ncbi:hypothetical protein N480_23945 [Pseudoalteromonas luteoviolacea S2607]|nr:hypothetical protein N480_23945 [Pseudoalteromonas luteoviolacea S2607]
MPKVNLYKNQLVKFFTNGFLGHNGALSLNLHQSGEFYR